MVSFSNHGIRLFNYSDLFRLPCLPQAGISDFSLAYVIPRQNRKQEE
jgi:hypothetical protein